MVHQLHCEWNIFLSCLIFEFREELLAAEAADKVSLDGGEVVEGRRVEDVLVAGGRSYSMQLLNICIRHSHRQDADPWRKHTQLK